jgi:signal transduction histidine kinase
MSVSKESTFGVSSFGASAFERHLERRLPDRWMGWRLRGLVAAVLLGCLAAFGLLQWMATSPFLDAQFTTGPQGQLLLAGSKQPALSDAVGHTVLSLAGADGANVRLDALVLHRSPRWVVRDDQRERAQAQQRGLAKALATGQVSLLLAQGPQQRLVQVKTGPRGFTGLGLLVWPLTALALVLYLCGVMVCLVRPQGRNLLFVLMTCGQAGALIFVALDTLPGLGQPARAINTMVLRMVLDLVTAAAGLHSLAVYPRLMRGAAYISTAAWAACAVVLGLATSGLLAELWWATQALMLCAGYAALAIISLSYRQEANPYAAVLRRMSAFAVGTLTLVTAGVALSAGQPGLPNQLAVIGHQAWSVFFASLLLLSPFITRSKNVLREFAMLAGLSTVATSLDLLFVAAFSFGQFTSLTLAVFVSLGLYAALRQRMLNQAAGRGLLTTERTFEQLYRVAREVQEKPRRYHALLIQLLRDLFEPLDAVRIERALQRSRVMGNGSGLMVPVRQQRGGDGKPAIALVLRFAQSGRRLFTLEDARLADRVVEQLRRAVAYDQAVERGRSEERLRIAQDLHDDIGARLLTLMYQAPTPELEDYIRHTLLDLKTLTRGLAASEHRLSHAAAEWKSDLTQRLTAAHVQLGWNFETDRDLTLGVVQWSALTRVLRELVSNAIYHAHASRVDVHFRLSGSRLSLSVADDGQGREPALWAHGLGLGGVRKRVKLLGGEVRWRENGDQGIVCEVTVAEFSAKR